MRLTLFVFTNSQVYSMIKQNINSLLIYSFDKLSEYREIEHFVSTRLGGFSAPPYKSLNLGFHVEDERITVLKNRILLASTLGKSLNNFTVAKQVHQANVTVITEDLIGKGAADYRSAIESTDAMITNVPDIYLMVFLADCVPILFFDPTKRVIGIVHSGWKGTLKLIAQKTVKALQKNFSSLPEDIIAAIGPSIGPCCYEVGSEVIEEVKNAFKTKNDYIVNESTDGNGYFNLWKANKTQLVKAGIPERNIEVAEICTCCNADIFFSARSQKGKTGRFGAGIIILDRD